MEWRDEGLIIGVRRHGEGSAIVEAMTRAHGRHLGLVRGGRSAPGCNSTTAAAVSSQVVSMPRTRMALLSFWIL
jgi:recombinational DNA repair protein (RecF pathway)